MYYLLTSSVLRGKVLTYDSYYFHTYDTGLLACMKTSAFTVTLSIIYSQSFFHLLFFLRFSHTIEHINGIHSSSL